MTLTEKIAVMVFNAVGLCSCSQTGFLGRVYEAVKKHRSIVEFKEYSADSEVANQYGIRFRGVVVGNRLVGSNPTASKIEKAILQEAEKQGIEAS